MPGFFHFLRCAGKALVKHAPRALVGLVPMGAELYDAVREMWADYRGANKEQELRAEIQEGAQTGAAEARQIAEQVVHEVAADQPPEVQVALTAYLSQVPNAVRQSLRRPTDPTGKTVPATLALRQPEDLLPFLPARLPRFKPGDCPPGVGDWELVELLGTGGFGEVWKARHLTLTSRKPVALKFCLDDAAAGALRNEAQLLDRVMQQGQQPGIVPLLQTYLRAEPHCLEYEYVAGGDLSGLIQEHPARGDPSPQFAAQIILRLAETIDFAHRLNPPIVHRDLKPANILVQRNADGTVSLLVADFGIGGIAAAQVIRQETGQRSVREQTLPSAVRGAYTPLYASPQQRRGEKPDPRDDVHALGVMWHQFLAGDLTAERPGGRGWRKKLENRGMAPGLIDLLESCIDDEAAERPANAGDLAMRIEQLLNPPTPKPQQPSVPAPSKPTATPGLSKDITNSLGMKLVLVPCGTFWMGDRGNQTQVRIPRDYYMGVYPVTQEQWQTVMGSNPSYFTRGGGGADKVKGFSEADLKLFPVEQVSWDDVQEFLKRLNAREKNSGFVYRLPTEAEWEYSCRGGATSQKDCAFDFYFSQSTNDLDAGQANFNNSLRRTSKVGSYKPKQLGLYDMHGNVWEWCEDTYQAGGSTRVDPGGSWWGGSARVRRGGGWWSNAPDSRASYRDSYDSSSQYDYLGFRLAAVPSEE